MDISDTLLCLFTGELEEREDGTVVRIPQQEIDVGAIDPGETYRIAILERGVTAATTQSAPTPQHTTASPRDRTQPEPPLDEGDTVDLEIEGIGDQGDGIARVERGFIVIVPDTEKGERVTVTVTDVKPTVAFAEVVERHHPRID